MKKGRVQLSSESEWRVLRLKEEEKKGGHNQLLCVKGTVEMPFSHSEKMKLLVQHCGLTDIPARKLAQIICHGLLGTWSYKMITGCNVVTEGRQRMECLAKETLIPPKL